MTTADLWFHIIDDHKIGLYSLHGDPYLMHGALVAFGLCDRNYDEENAR